MMRHIVLAAALVLLAAPSSPTMADPGEAPAYGRNGQGNSNDYGHAGPAPILGAGVPLYILAALGYRSWKRRRDRARPEGN